MAVESSHDRSKYNPTGVPGLEFRWRADGSRTFYGFVPSRGRMKLNSRKQREARAELNELLGKAAKGETVAPVNKRFKDVAEEWFASKRKLRPWTRRSYRAALDLVLIPRFGHLKIRAVSTSLIAALIRDLEAKGLNAIDCKRPVRPLSQAAIDNYLKPLSGTLRFAASKGLVGTNAYLALTSDERPDTETGRRATYEWSDEEVKAVLDAAEIRGRARIAVRLQPAHPHRDPHGPATRRAARTQVAGHRLGRRGSARSPAVDAHGRAGTSEDKERHPARSAVDRLGRFPAQAQARVEALTRHGLRLPLQDGRAALTPQRAAARMGAGAEARRATRRRDFP
jgi:hypothetical protein